MAVRPQPRLFTVEEYDRMVEAGILGENERVELVSGGIVQMTAIGSRQAACVNRLNALFSKHVSDRAIIQVQNPVRASELSEPEPDLGLLRPEATITRRHTRARATCSCSSRCGHILGLRSLGQSWALCRRWRARAMDCGPELRTDRSLSVPGPRWVRRGPVARGERTPGPPGFPGCVPRRERHPGFVNHLAPARARSSTLSGSARRRGAVRGSWVAIVEPSAIA